MNLRTHHFQDGTETKVELYSFEEQSKVDEIIRDYSGTIISYYEKYLQKHTLDKHYKLSDGRIVQKSKFASEIYENEVVFLIIMAENGLLFSKKNIYNGYPKYTFTYINSSSKITYYEINNEFANGLINSLPKVDIDIWPRVRIGRYLQGVLSIEPARGTAFYYQSLENCLNVIQSRSEFMAKLKNSNFKIYPEFLGLNYTGADFLLRKDELISTFYNLMGLEKTNQELSSIDIQNITHILYLNLFTWQFLEICFLPLLAFTGDCFIKKNGGAWALIECPVFNDSMPDVIYNGKPMELFGKVYEVLSPSFSKFIPLESLLISSRP